MTDDLMSMGNSHPVYIRSMADIADATVRGLEQGALLLDESNLGPEFFDLRSGLAGELFQKFVNYQTRLAIVISDATKYGDRFNQLVHEHRRHPGIRFFQTEPEASAWLEV